MGTLRRRRPFAAVIEMGFQSMRRQTIFGVTPGLGNINEFPRRVRFVGRNLFMLTRRFN